MPAFYIVVIIIVILLFFCGAFFFKPLGRFVLSLYEGVRNAMFGSDDEDDEE